MEKKRIELSKAQCKVLVEALSNYQDLICAGDLDGSDYELNLVQQIINKIQLAKFHGANLKVKNY